MTLLAVGASVVLAAGVVGVAHQLLRESVTGKWAQPEVRWAPQERARLEAQVVRAERAAKQHRNALHALSEDARWADPAQRDHLARAMRQSSAAFAEKRDRTRRLRLLLRLHP